MKYLAIKQVIIEELRDMGFNFKHMGTTYIVEAIEYIYNSDDPLIGTNLEKNVYSEIAKKYNKNARTIKSDIVKATDYRYDRFIQRKKKNSDYGSLYSKMTPKAIINIILLKLKS